jgi:single-stranded DNA-binding protein
MADARCPGFLLQREIRAGPDSRRMSGWSYPVSLLGVASVAHRQPDVLGFQGMFLRAVGFGSAEGSVRPAICPFPALVSVRRGAGSRNRPLAALATGGQRSFPRGRGHSGCRLRRRSFFFARLENILAARPAGMTGPGAAALPPDRREGPAVPRPPPGRPTLPVTTARENPMNPISITVTGRLGDNPRSFTTRDGTDGVELRLALDIPSRVPGGDSVTRWVKVSAFGLLATRTAESVRKGDRVTVVAEDFVAEAWAANGSGEPRARIALRAQEIAASMAFDTVRTGYAARKAARLAAANGEPNDLPVGEQAEIQVLSGVVTS